MPGPVYLSGERVDLRVVEREDVEFLQYARNDPDLRTLLAYTEPKSHDQMEEFYEEKIATDNGDASFVVCPTDEADPIGEVSLYGTDHDRGELAYWLLSETRGDGYGVEAVSLLIDYAFRTRGLHRVYARAVDDNEPSWRLLERLGFSLEGRLRDHMFLDGEYREVRFYGLLRAEWNGRPE